MKSEKQKYIELCEEESSIPIFSQAWWLDLVCGSENWDVVIVEKSDKVVAAMPYHFVQRYSAKQIVQPVLTQTMGPWIKKTNIKYTKYLAKQKDFMNEMILKLPNYSFFKQNWQSDYTNWLPFYWNGFQQTSKVTYKLRNISDLEVIYKNFEGKVRTEIKKAEKLGLTIDVEPDISEFITLNTMVFSRQNKALPYSLNLVEKLYEACRKRQQGRIFLARDTEGIAHAAVFVIWDVNSAYYIMGGGDPKLRNSGATSLCMWHAIKYCSTVTSEFDFEGSMLEPVERFFRGFGAEQVLYHSVFKNNSRLMRFLEILKLLVAGK